MIVKSRYAVTRLWHSDGNPAPMRFVFSRPREARSWWVVYDAGLLRLAAVDGGLVTAW